MLAQGERAAVRSVLACATWVPPFSSVSHLSTTRTCEHALGVSDSSTQHESASQCPRFDKAHGHLSTRTLLQHLRQHKQQQGGCRRAPSAQPVAHEHAHASPLPSSDPTLPQAHKLQLPHCPPPHLRLNAWHRAHADGACKHISTPTPAASAMYIPNHMPALLGLRSTARHLSMSAAASTPPGGTQQQPHIDSTAEHISQHASSAEGPSSSSPAVAPAAAPPQHSTEASADSNTEGPLSSVPAAATPEAAAAAQHSREAGANTEGPVSSVPAAATPAAGAAAAAAAQYSTVADPEADFEMDSTALGLSNVGSAAWDALDIISDAEASQDGGTGCREYDRNAFVADYERLVGRPPSLMALRTAVQLEPKMWSRTTWKLLMEHVTDFVHAIGPRTVHAILYEAPHVVIGVKPHNRDHVYKIIKNLDAQLSLYMMKTSFYKDRTYHPKQCAQEKNTVTEDDPGVSRGVLAIVEHQEKKAEREGTSSAAPEHSHSQPSIGGDTQPSDNSSSSSTTTTTTTTSSGTTTSSSSSNLNKIRHHPQQARAAFGKGQWADGPQGGFLQVSPLTLELISKRPQLAKSSMMKAGVLEAKLRELEVTLQLPPPIVWNMVRTLPWLLTVTSLHVHKVAHVVQEFMESDEMQPALVKSITHNSKATRNVASRSSTKEITKKIIELGVWPPANVPTPDASGKLPPRARSHVAACFARTTLARRPLLFKFNPRVLKSKLNRVREFVEASEGWHRDLQDLDHSELGLILVAPFARFNRFRYLQELGITRNTIPRNFTPLHKVLHAKSRRFEAAFPGYFEWSPGQSSVSEKRPGRGQSVAEDGQGDDQNVTDSELPAEEASVSVLDMDGGIDGSIEEEGLPEGVAQEGEQLGGWP